MLQALGYGHCEEMIYDEAGVPLAHSLQRYVSYLGLIADADVADGEHVAFCDHDDVWLPWKLERAVQGIRADALHAFSSVGSYVLGFGFLLSGICLLGALFKKPDAPDNPWDGTTLEWKTASPPPLENFSDQPVITAGPYDR